MGMFIVDDIYYSIPRAPVTDIIGGAGSYAVLGARIMRGSGHTVGWTIHAGSDFPETVRKEVQSWGTRCEFVDTPERLTTRGLNVYREKEKRDFEFATPKVRIDERTLTIEQLGARAFHLCCGPLRCASMVQGILELREQMITESKLPADAAYRPTFIWEPVPGHCNPVEWTKCLEVLPCVTVVSPNLEEFQAFLGTTMILDAAGRPNLAKLDSECYRVLSSSSSGNLKAIVVRMGEFGARVVSWKRAITVGAYHRSYQASRESFEERNRESKKVVDPTGAGNAFLGGFAIGFLEGDLSKDCFEKAAVYGSVAASFAIEQVGMPILTSMSEGTEKGERWNGEFVGDRLRSYQDVPEDTYFPTEAINHQY